MFKLKKLEHLRIPFKDIESATNNFNAIIGRGGFGVVYRGKLSFSGEPTTVAVKRLDSKLSGQGIKEFLTEIQLLSSYEHPNLISLLGFCDEGDEKLLVYQYAENGSLDRYLSGDSLTWVQRLEICLGAARGLDYLHNGVARHHRIIHRDIKSSNILLDHNWGAKISDLGLSKLGLANQNNTFLVSNACGTLGYCDPDYISSGILTKESDVYSFGVVLFEVLCGRPCHTEFHDERQFLGPFAKLYYENSRLDEIIDPTLRKQMDTKSLNAFSAIAYQCLQADRRQRPRMNVVVEALEDALRFQSFGRCESRSDVVVDDDDVVNINPPTGNVVRGKREPTWSRDMGKYAGGDFSMAVAQANRALEDQSQIVSGPFGTFVGVYDGHGGPEAARYVCDNLFRNFQEASAEDNGIVTPGTIERAFRETESGFTALVSKLWNTRPSIAEAGSCCLVGVIHQQTLFIANLGDPRVVLGKKVSNTGGTAASVFWKKVGNTGGMAAIQLSTEHNVSLEDVRQELKDLHPHDPHIVVLKRGVWRVKGIIKVSRSIGDVYMKHARYNREPLAARFRLPEPMVMPILSATPTIISHHLETSDLFLIFASDGLWEYLTNEEAVDIVHNNPRKGIAMRLVKAAMQKAAKKREMRYSDLRMIATGTRRNFHDDITVIVLFLNHDLLSTFSLRSPLEISV